MTAQQILEIIADMFNLETVNDCVLNDDNLIIELLNGKTASIVIEQK